ncbi:hypothetical protein M407DRAFT_18966 [Tulasnella calospora MUT 4182]|uniref:Uncharacterized protein n=1 Tax=Tulasnella calospora MUT 4182 TaxID=1051891 RepID=A0A0C3MEG6_9AGAM|nr:hypothetical protein M407DRAFT_18966 [Tulasnella calospora MUT 4182]
MSSPFRQFVKGVTHKLDAGSRFHPNRFSNNFRQSPPTHNPSTTASSASPPHSNDAVIFRGESAEECEEFLYKVRRAVVDKGRQDDEKWITSYAASCMSGPALRWHVLLDVDTKSSWDALQRALITQWPAEQLKAIPSGTGKLKLEGLVKVVRHSETLGYLRHQLSETTPGITVSSSVEEAARVLYRPSNSLAEFELMGSPGDLRYLGGTMMDPPSTYDYPSSKSAAHRLRDAALSTVGAGIHCSRLRNSRGRDCISRSDIWGLNDAGSLQAYCPVNSNVELRTCMNIASGNIYLVESIRHEKPEEDYLDVTLAFEATPSREA